MSSPGRHRAAPRWLVSKLKSIIATGSMLSSPAATPITAQERFPGSRDVHSSGGSRTGLPAELAQVSAVMLCTLLVENEVCKWYSQNIGVGRSTDRGAVDR